MKSRMLRSCFLAFLIAPSVCYCYETETHALMTNQAYTKSVLAATGPTSVVHNLGLDRLTTSDPFFAYWINSGLPQYFDEPPASAGGTSPFVDATFPGEFERCQMQEFLSLPPGDARHDLFANTVDAVSGGFFTLPIQNWLVRGAIREDDLGVLVNLYTYFWQRCGALDILPTSGGYLRVLNHFYDPINDVGLGACPLGATCQKSVDWALGVVSSFPTPPQMPQVDSSRRNHFSYADARNNYWWALTKETGLLTPPYTAANRKLDSKERLYRWATTFRSLGDTVHLLQDTAQPQHVRNDPHSNAQNPEQQALEGFTNARVLGQPVGAIGGDGGRYVRSFFGNDLSAVINPPPLGTYGITTPIIFATPLRFFTTRNYNDTPSSNPDLRYGMADYANRGFFTGGTLPGSPGNTFQEPKATIDAAHGYTALPVPCLLMLPLPNVSVSCVHYTHTVLDTVNTSYAQNSDVLPAGFTIPNAPIVSDSVLAAPLQQIFTSPTAETTAISIEELMTIANLTIPRAIGYSTGMINFFFRGSIQVDAPQDGLFGLVDHALAHTVDVDGYPHCTSTAPGAAGEPDFCTANAIYGFTKIRLQLHNNTPAITESGTAGPAIAQAMKTTLAAPGPTDPQLVAVARYHRNLCYQATLQGEAVIDYQGTITENNCGAGNRTGYQEIAVSKPLAVTDTNLNGTSSMPVAFDFSADPIPINATDLFIQVVYRGQLGNEPDGIAVGTIDVNEPSYITLWNDSDHAGCNGAWATGNGNGCVYTNGIGKGINNAYICIGGQSVYHRFNTGGNGDIFLGKFVRLAALLDNQSHMTKASLDVGTEMAAVYIHKTITGQMRQNSMEQETVQAPYVPAPMFIKRGMIGSFRPMPFYMLIGADPQPTSDSGALDVGALTPAYVTGLPDTGGTMSFPNTPPAPIAGCTN